jgi:branched-chain amino acid transport system permease protein
MQVKDRLSYSTSIVKGYLTRAYSSFVANIFDVPSRLLAFLYLLLMLLLPVSGLRLSALVYAFVYAILALSWDLLVGRTGQVSLGHAFFFTIGAYCSAIFSLYYGSSMVIGIPTYIITIIVALAISVLIAIVVGLPALRVKGPYLGVFTFCIALVMYYFTNWSYVENIFGGTSGVAVPFFFSFLRGNPIRGAVEYYFALAILFFSAIIVYKIATSKTGIVFISILDNELASKACGINVTKYKLIAFAISGFFASLAGCIYVYLLIGRVRPLDFYLDYSFLPITFTFIGGLGTIYGPIAGAVIYKSIEAYLFRDHIKPLMSSMGFTAQYEQLVNAIFAVVILIIILKWPRGIARTVVDKLNDLAKPRDIEERGPRIWKKYKKEGKESRLQKIFSRFKKKQK